jgi:hypothetical protein
MMLARTSGMVAFFFLTRSRHIAGSDSQKCWKCRAIIAQDADAALVRHEHNILGSVAKQLAIQNRRMAGLVTLKRFPLALAPQCQHG